MRTLKRNLSKVQYALFNKTREILDKDGRRTGEYEQTFFEPVTAYMNVSSAKGETDSQLFGISLDYDKTLVTTDMTLSIDEQSVMWIDEKDTTKPFDYIVKKVARSLNSITYAVKKVNVS